MANLRIDAHVSLHVKTIFQIDHDLLDTSAQVLPCRCKVLPVRDRWHKQAARCDGHYEEASAVVWRRAYVRWGNSR